MPIPNYVQYSANGTINGSISGAAPFTVTFVDTSSTPSFGTTLTWFWDFGDASSSSLQNPPPHAYLAAGTYNPTLTQTFSSHPPVDSTGNNTVVTVTAPAVTSASGIFQCVILKNLRIGLPAA
jgi:PKD repeat protein